MHWQKPEIKYHPYTSQHLNHSPQVLEIDVDFLTPVAMLYLDQATKLDKRVFVNSTFEDNHFHYLVLVLPTIWSFYHLKPE